MKICLMMFAIAYSQFVFSQNIIRRVVDSEEKTPIPYATIKVMNSPRGVIASEQGEFVIPVDSTDLILITSVGYKNRILKAVDMAATIELIPRTKEMENITVRNMQFIRFVTVGFPLSMKPRETFDWGPSVGQNTELGQRFNLPNDTLVYKIRKVNARVEEIQCFGSMVLHIYEVDSAGFPAGEIFNKEIAVDKSMIKRDNLIINLAEEDVYIERRASFFVSFTWRPDYVYEICVTAIVLFPLEEENMTLVRTVAMSDFRWVQSLYKARNNQETRKLSTLFSVELSEFRYQ